MVFDFKKGEIRMSEIFTREAADEILRRITEGARAAIFQGSTQKPFGIQKEVVDLSTASVNPKRIGFPFRSIYVESATDVLANISLKPNSSDSFQSAIKLKQNDSWSRDLPVSEAYLSWDAQPGKTITLVYMLDSEFRSGSQISVTGGGVSIVDGSTVTGPTRVTLAATTAAAIAPALSTRKKATIENKTGADLYIGDSTVTNSGATEGIKVAAGGIIYWQNTGALYGYSVAGGNVHRLEET
jgi:hypothetical protein